MRKLLLIILSVLIYTTTYAQNITTVAGGLGDDISAMNTPLYNPSGTAVDAAGNVYIADTYNNRIRKVTISTGIISTIVGNGIQGYAGDGSAATSANLSRPSGVALDGLGNIYIVDQYNHRIRKVTASTGIISTIAGNGTQGYGGDGSAATSANLDNPRGIALDGLGNIYIADLLNHRIRKVTASTGIISTVAGNGTQGYGGDDSLATSANLNNPFGVAVDAAGNIYIADYGNNKIRKVSSLNGKISTVAGNGSRGYYGDGNSATSANLNNPIGVAVDGSGNIYFADKTNHRIRKVTASTNIISTIAGNGSSGYNGDGYLATWSNLYNPSGVAVDGLGNIYFADYDNNRVRKVTASTGFISTVAGNGTQGYGGDGNAAISASIYGPSGVAVDGSGNIYIADARNNRIRKVNASTGIINTVVGNGGNGYGGDGIAATSANLNNPNGIAVDGSGNIYIADYGNNRIRKVTASTGIITTVAGNGPPISYGGDGSAATSAYFNCPIGVAVDGSGNIYIADYYNNRIRKVTASTGIISTVAGNGIYGSGGDGSAATSANLSNPCGVAVDGSGNIYIADYYNNRIRKVTASTGIITTVAGNGIYGSGGDGNLATSANLNTPTGVAVDGSGNIYIADSYNNRIRKVTASTGIITTVAGNGTGSYGGDGNTATSASIYNPYGVALDGSGNIYIADNGNNRIRKVKNNIISSSQTICAGSAPSIITGSTPIGSTGINTYSWLSSTTSATAGFSAIPSTNTINYSPGVLTQNTWFRRHVVSGALTDTSEVIAITVNTIPTAPSTPTRVSKTATSINVTWGAVSGATGYKLDVSTNSGFTALVSGYSNTSVAGTSTSITGLTGSTTYYVRVRAVNATLCNSVSSSVLTETTPASTVSLTLRAYLQGLYAGGKMISAPFNADGTSPQNIADTITVELRANTTPYNVIHAVKGLLDTAGNATITFPGSVNGNSYYIVIGHRNSVAVWSANPVAFSANTNYDFTNAATKAFGSNMVQAGGVFMLFSGDINQDGSIDFADYPDFEISSGNSDLGYLPYDLNGDASVDFADYPLIDINSSNGVIILTP